MFSPLSRGVLLLLLCLLAAPGQAAQVALSFDAIRHDAFEVDGMTLAFDAQHQGEADIRLHRLRVGGLDYRELRLHCSDFYFDGHRLDCPHGTVRRDDARGGDRPPLAFSLAYRAGDGQGKSPRDGFFEFALHDVDAVDLSPLVKNLRGWKPAGKVDFRVTVQGGKAVLHLALRDVGFAHGDVSAKGIAATVDAAAEHKGDGWDWQADIDWPQGELARPPWRRAGGVRIAAAGTMTPAQIDVHAARLEVAGFGAVNASLLWDRVRDEPAAWGFVTERLDLATAMREWVQPWLTQLGFPAWRTQGHARFSAESKNGRLLRFYAGLEDATLADSTGHIRLSGITASIPWEADAPTEAEFGVTDGALGDLPLGKFSFPIHIAGGEARIRNLVAPMLDGKFNIDALTLTRGDDGWRGEFSGGIAGVSMPKLSRALGMPVMAGTFTAGIPRVAYDKGTLAFDGALAIQVFDGVVAVHRLRVIDAFDAQRRFLVDVTARNLDLGMLTQTFSFGSISGRFDADLHDLEMIGWKPLRFEARLASSPGDFPRQVSLGALRDITAMGDSDGATTFKQLPERAIDFGYARVGIAASLANGVCTVAGIDGGDPGESARDGIVLMEGSGFPSIRIIGYNPRIDWDALVARIRGVLAGKSAMLVQ